MSSPSPILPPDPANPTVLGFGITMGDLKSYLGYALTDTTADFKLTMLFNAAVATMGSLLGRNLVFGSYRDTFKPMFSKVYLTETPVKYVYQLHDGNGNITDPTSYQFYPKDGLVQFQYNWTGLSGYFYDCGNTYVDYVGGYETLPGDLLQALFTALQAGDVYQKQIAATGSVVKRLTVYDVGVTEYATSSSTASVLSDTLSVTLSPYLLDGGYTIGAPNIHQSMLMGPAGFWDPTEAGSPLAPPQPSPITTSPVTGGTTIDTTSKYGLGAANAYLAPAALLASMTDISGNAFTVTTTLGEYAWVAALASTSTNGIHFFDGVGYGGWSGAGLPGNNTGNSDTASVSNILYTDPNGTTWRFFREDYVNANPSPSTYTLS